MNTTDALKRNLQRIPDEIAIIQGERSFSWRELCDRVARLAGALSALKVKPGEHVATLLGNSWRNIESVYAAQWLGAAIVPVNIRWTAPEVNFAVEDCGARVLFVDAMNWPTVEKMDKALLKTLTLIWADDGEAPATTTSFESLIESYDPLSCADQPGSAIASIFYTGGTTGRSKGVLLSHENQVSHSIALVADCGLMASGGRYLHAAPMFHIADSLFTHVVSLMGGTHIILPAFTPAAVAEQIEQHRINFTVLVPTMIQMLMADKAISQRAFTVLEKLFYGASPMPEALIQNILKSYPTLELCQLYGQTESSPVLTILPLAWHGNAEGTLPQARSAGRAMMGTEVKIVDPEGNDLPVGENGEIVARGPQVMQGYWHREEETANALRGGWLHTGDAGYMDELGFIYVVDRIKDMIITGGENVYTIEVEPALYRMAGVAQCSVIGLPHDKWGEAVHAVVVPATGAEITEAQVLEHCKNLLADYKRPRSVTIRTEPLPLSGAGKILKRELRLELG